MTCRTTFAAALALALVAPSAFARQATERRLPPYKGLAVDRIPAGEIQHVVFEITTRTTRDGQQDESEPDHTERFETWNSRSAGRSVVSLAAGRWLSDSSKRELRQGDVIEENSVADTTCRRWDPERNVITRRRCTGVNDRETAIFEHNETGLAHHFRHRSRSFYEIAVVRSGGRLVVRFHSELATPGGSRETVGEVPEDAPKRGPGHTERTARLTRRGLRLFSDVTRSRHEIEGHVHERVSTLRVISREMLPDTRTNRAKLRMHHPGATVTQGAAVHERPR